MDKTIEVKRTLTHYEIYVNGIFYSSCDFNELREEMEEIENVIPQIRILDSTIRYSI